MINLEIELSVIVPCLNEEDNICEALNILRKELEGIDYEVLIIDDQSNDETKNVAEYWISENNVDNYIVLKKDMARRGYGAVIKYGLAYASGRYVMFYSADMVDPIHLTSKMLRLVRENDLVQVSRYQDPSNARDIPFKYKFYQFFYRRFAHIALGDEVVDSTYAFKIFDRRLIMSLGLSSNRFSISPEILFKSHLAGRKIVFVEGAQSHREKGASKFIFMKEGPGFIWCLLRAFLHRTKILFWF